MPKLQLIFNSKAKTTKINLQVEDGLDEKEERKYINKQIKQRWPNLQGTLQKTLRKD